MEAQIQREEDIKQEFTNIIENKGGAVLYLKFQPIMDLATGRICDFEALARMKSDKLGYVPPLDFIPAAERRYTSI
ncbi:MAG: EAL domain-containing protein [Clostridiaceae bacterium]|nr:EAL domain-containing protein [Clostridiaceae bacterium]